jgi:ribosomal protein L11 methyltransferase
MGGDDWQSAVAECDHLSQEMSVAAKSPHVWRKLGGAKWEDAWVERLTSFADRLAITSLPGAKTIRLEVFQLKKNEAEALRKMFGGTVAVQKKWTPAVQAQPRPPIKVRGKLLVVSSPAERTAAPDGVPALLIPAGMAFGTGEHATTATCLRLLADVADELTGQRWEMLDLGCGSGILGLAARVLGARKVEAGDFDSHAVRVAKENVKANGLNGVVVRKLDVRSWTPPRTWDVVAANIYSGILVEVAPTIAAAVAPAGRLVFSGILRTQEAEVLAAFEASGLRLDQVVRKGKWVTGRATRRDFTPKAR